MEVAFLLSGISEILSKTLQTKQVAFFSKENVGCSTFIKEMPKLSVKSNFLWLCWKLESLILENISHTYTKIMLTT